MVAEYANYDIKYANEGQKWKLFELLISQAVHMWNSISVITPAAIFKTKYDLMFWSFALKWSLIILKYYFRYDKHT